MTYTDLKRLLREHFTQTNNPVKLGKCLSNLGRFMEFYNQTDDSKVFFCFASDVFEKQLEEYSSNMIKAGKSLELTQEQKSHLRRVFALFTRLLTADDILKENWDFRTTLRQLILLNHKHITEFCRSKGFEVWRIQQFLQGKTLPTTKEEIERLESAFGLKANQLGNTLPKGFYQTNVIKQKTYEQKSGIGKLMHHAYRLKVKDLPDTAKEELKKLLEFKTAEYLQDGVFRNGFWRTKKTEHNKTTENYTKISGYFSGYFGFLVAQPCNNRLMSGLGISKNDLTVGLLSDIDKIRKYKAFHNARFSIVCEDIPENAVSGSYLAFLNECISLTNPKTGFLTQNYSLFGKKLLGESSTESDWKKHCDRSYDQLLQDKRNLSDQNLILRKNVFKNIQKIISRERPLDELYETIEAVKLNIMNIEKNDVQAKRKLQKDLDDAKMYLALLSLMTALPFRKENIQLMELGKNIYKREGEEGWRLRFTAFEMKNYRNKAVRNGIDIPIDPVNKVTKERVLTTSKYLDDYINNVRQRRAFAQESRKVFLTKRSEKMKRNLELFHKIGFNFYAFSRKMSEMFTPSKTKINPHSHRHIIAMHYLKTEPNGIVLAADALMDDELTIIKYYVQRTSEDRANAVNLVRYENEVRPKVLAGDEKAAQKIKLYDVDAVKERFKAFPMRVLITMTQAQLEDLVSANEPYVRKEFLKQFEEFRRNNPKEIPVKKKQKSA